MKNTILKTLPFCMIILLYSFSGGGGQTDSTTGLSTDVSDKCYSKNDKQTRKCNDAPRNLLITVDEPIGANCSFGWDMFCVPVLPPWASSVSSWYEDIEFMGNVSTQISCCSGYGTTQKMWNSAHVQAGCKIQVRVHTRYNSKLIARFYKPCSSCDNRLAYFSIPANVYIAPATSYVRITPKFVAFPKNC